MLNNIIFSISNYDLREIKRIRLIKKHFVPFCRNHGLAGRQQEVLLLALQNPTRQEMASALGVAVETVKMHPKHLYHKTQTHSQQERISRLLDFSAERDSLSGSAAKKEPWIILLAHYLVRAGSNIDPLP
jgi:DNA-binding CsgD family transcriptional regulator